MGVLDPVPFSEVTTLEAREVFHKISHYKTWLCFVNDGLQQTAAAFGLHAVWKKQ